jgi:hypothetical protein
MEVERRPAAAKRQGLVARAVPMSPFDPLMVRAAAPLKDFECYTFEVWGLHKLKTGVTGRGCCDSFVRKPRQFTRSA